MLELVIGASGCGKSRYVTEQLTALAEGGEQAAFLLVPEQASFEHERALLARLGARKAMRVQVLSFTRLADTVFRQVGGMAGQRLDEGTRALLMSRALSQVAAVEEDLGQPMRGLSPRKGVQAAYVQQLLTLWEEMKQSCVATRELERVADALALDGDEGSLLHEKTTELYRVLTAFEGLCAATGLDDLDKLTRLATVLPHGGLLNGAAVFVDGFNKGFTADELQVLEGIMTVADRLTVTLCSDTPGAAWPGVERAACRREIPLFAPVTDTVKRLRRLADSHGKQWELRHVTENSRTADAALQAVERQLYTPRPAVYDGPADSVTVTPCPSVYEECAYVARQVRRLIREEGYRCREIAVVTRDLSPYQGLLDDAFARQGIPCYMDTRRDLLSEPLVVYARAALRLAVDGWHTEDILRLLKTDLGPLDPVETAQLENYVYMWRVDGTAWEREFTENPDGLEAATTAATARRLAQLNSWRQQVMEPLITLRRALHGRVTGRAFATAMYTFLTADGQLPQRVVRQCATLEAMDEIQLAQRAETLWDEVMAILDRFAVALAEEALPASRLEDLFLMLCRLIDVGTIPHSLDAVAVGVANRVRFAAPRAVFVLGMNEGVFPAYPDGAGVFSEPERQQLRDRGLALSGDTLRQCVEERYYAYMAVAAPSQRLYLSYLDDGEQAPSPVIEMVKAIVPRHRTGLCRALQGYEEEGADDVFRRLAESYHGPAGVDATLLAAVEQREDYAARLAAVRRSAAGESFALTEPDMPAALFGQDMRLSASRTDAFYKCRFSYFCLYGLHIAPRRVAQMDFLSFGNVVHKVMELVLPRYTAPGGLVDTLREEDKAGRTDEQETALQAQLLRRLNADAAQVVEHYVQETMGGKEGKSGRFLYQLGQAKKAAANLLWHTVMELRQSEFDPVDFELKIHPDDEEGAGLVSMRLPHTGGSLQLMGSIDRVDMYVRADGTAFVRVVDYKTGTKTFDLNELAMGLNMQMLIYLFVLCDNVGYYPHLDSPLQPAGVLYHPLDNLMVDKGQSTKDRLKKMCMDGVVLDDAGVVMAMEAAVDHVFVPVSMKKTGELKGSLLTEPQFRLLRQVVERLVVNMADSLMAGDIAASPVHTGKSPVCAYCAYRAICGHEEADPVRQPDATAWQTLVEQAGLQHEGEEATVDE